jgi:hypothetical protein
MGQFIPDRFFWARDEDEANEQMNEKSPSIHH